MTAIYHNENDAACCSVLRRQFPDAVIDDRSIADVQPHELNAYRQCHFFAGIGGFSLGFRNADVSADVNVWTGGFPCQDLSVAGKREGLAGSRSGFFFEFHRLVSTVRPQYVVIENVPGLLSSNDGRDFAIVLGGLTGIIPRVPGDGWGNAGFARGPVYNVAYRILDAQFFGVAQRRRRVFIVGSLGDGRSAEVLFEREGLFGHPPKVNKQWQGITPSVASGINGSGLRGRQPGSAASLVSTPLVFNWQSGGDVRHSFSEKPMLQANQTPAIFQQNQRNEVRNLDNLAGSIQAQPGMKQQNYVFFGDNNRSGAIGRRPRRLTPTECERLQGFPDVEKCVIINVCTDHQKNSANAESRNPRLQKHAGSVGKGNLLETARFAENSFDISNPPISEHVAVSVQINLERQVLQIHSHGKLLLSVNIAESKSLSPLRMPIEDFARIVALTITTQEKIIRNGKGELRQNTMPSIHQPNGSSVVNLSGDVIGELVDDVEEFTKMANLCSTFTTLEVAQNSLNLEQISTILSYYVATVTASFIPELTNPTSSYNLKLSTVSGWTAGQSDTQRYRQLGNAVAVPVARWIGERIIALGAINNKE